MSDSRGKKLHDFSGAFITETAAAWCVRLDDDKGTEWFPKSQCHIRAKDEALNDPDAALERGTPVWISVPEWLGQKKSLL